MTFKRLSGAAFIVDVSGTNLHIIICAHPGHDLVVCSTTVKFGGRFSRWQRFRRYSCWSWDHLLAKNVISHCCKRICALSTKEDSHYLAPKVTSVVWCGTVKALAQAWRTGSPFTSFWKADFTNVKNLRWRVTASHSMDEQHLRTHITFEYFLVLCRTLLNCHQLWSCLIWNKGTYCLPVHSKGIRQGDQ